MSAQRLCLLTGLLWFGLMAGFFYSYSVTVSPGFLAASPQVALEAMQAINASVRNLFFAIGFWGALVVSIALLAVASVGKSPRKFWIIAACLIYLGGAFAVTIFGSVPLNQALALVDPASPDAPDAILGYLRDWTALNHVRTASAVAALLFCAIVAVTGEA